MIDNQSLNANWKQAQEHAMSTRPGKIETQQQNNSHYKTLLCPCCLNPIQKQPISYCQNVKELDCLGFGFPLFYDFAINCIVLLVVFVCSYNAISLYKAIQYNSRFCNESSPPKSLTSDNQLALTYAVAEFVPFSRQKCFSFMLLFAHVQSQTAQGQLVLRTTSFILHMLVLLYLRNKHRLLKEYYKQRTTLISHYSILVKGIPLNLTGLKSKFDKFFSREFSNSPKIQQITFAPDIQNIEQLEKQRSKLIHKKKSLLKKIDTTNSQVNIQNQAQSEQLREIRLQLQAIKQKINDSCLQLDKQIRLDTVASEKVIITFNTEAQKYWVKKQFKQLPKQRIKQYFGQNCKNMTFYNAPEPKQIIWQNFNLKSSSKFVKLIIGWSLSVAFLILVTLAFYVLMNKKANMITEYLQHKQAVIESQNPRLKAVFLVYFSLVCIIIFNKFGMAALLHKCSHIERHQTTSDQQFSFTLKYSFGLLFTTAFMTLAVEAITHKNYFTHQFGVVEEETIMFFLNSFFVPLIWLINPLWIIRRIKRKIKFQSPKLTQKQANQLMEDPRYEIGKRYAEILETMWFTFFYATLIPFGAFLSLLGIVLYYIIDKYNLLSRSSIHGNISQRLSQYSTTLLQLTLLFRPLGQIIFDYHIRKSMSFHPLSLIFLVVAIIYLLLPLNFILKRSINERFNLSEHKFEDTRYKFTQTYHTLHPVYRELYLKHHLKKRNLTMGIILPSGIEIQGMASDARIIDNK